MVINMHVHWKPLSDADKSKEIVAHWREHIKHKSGGERFISHKEISGFDKGEDKWVYYWLDDHGCLEDRDVPLDAVCIEIPDDLWPGWADVAASPRNAL